ncbi:MAG TPA: DUF4132 domain-containing protein [Candidatus Limnocylindrales bacterium]
MGAGTSYPERIATIRTMVELGETKPLADELVEVAAMADGYWGDGGAAISGYLYELPEAARLALTEELLARVDRRPGVQGKLTGLASFLVSKLAHASPQAAETATAVAARQMWASASELATNARILRAAGRTIRAEVVAVIRRTAELDVWGGKLLRDQAQRLTEPPLNVGEQWADAVLEDLPKLDDAWRELIAHAGQATSAKPSGKWDKRAAELLAALGPQHVCETLVRWLGLVGRARSIPLQRRSYDPEVNELFDAFNANVLRGLLWILSLLPPAPESARTLGAIVETSLRKVAGHGPRSPKVANAAVFALSRMDGEAALAQIARLAARVTFKGTLNELNKALDRRAEALGLARDEVEELAVPTYGLENVGHRKDSFGPASAETTVANGAVSVVWRNDSGRVVKSAPAAVRSAHGDELKEFKAAVKDLEKMLAAQSERLDRQFLAQRVWRFDVWRERYLDHPLLGTLARRLIWTVDGDARGFADGALRTLDGGETAPDPGAEVRLWHPIDHPVDEVMAWRDWLERHEITQPFKQAHREVYVLTDAERATGVYSNRFAAHILRQHQFHALAAVRGWRNKLRLMVDDEYPPASRELPRWGLRAEFWVEGIGDDYSTDATESGSYLRIATDQVRFYPTGAPQNWAHAGGGPYRTAGRRAEPLALQDIPPLVLSEVLRDIDLFVGVASVGNDPTWQDGGPEGRFREYWHDYSFGELSETAQTRRDLLTRLLPRLAIADRATISGRFLKVRGELRTYKIHLGSGNILMEPNDEYLCIVPTQTPGSPEAGTGGLFLPFEGDRTLAVILSKAMLLAKDEEITDLSITRQIRPRS